MSASHSIAIGCALEECWLPVVGWPGYDVSDWGRVRSYWMRGGKGRTRIIGPAPMILKGAPHVRSGHIGYHLHRYANGKRERRIVLAHILVLNAFVGPCPTGMEGCHYPDPDPANNRLENVRWDTRKGNARDSFRQGIHSSARISPGDVSAIRRRIANGESFDEIADDYGVTPFAIRDIKTGRTWAYIAS